MVHPPGRLLHIDSLRCRCLGSSRATDTIMHRNSVSEQRLGRRSDGQSVRGSGRAAAPRS
eukprot:7064430-Prymnesium_polylepis.1